MNFRALIAIAALSSLAACGGGVDPTPEESLAAVTSLQPKVAVPPPAYCVIGLREYTFLINVGALPPKPSQSTSLLERYDWKPPFLVLKPEFRQELITLASIPALGPYYDPNESAPPAYVCKE